jgi:amidase
MRTVLRYFLLLPTLVALSKSTLGSLLSGMNPVVKKPNFPDLYEASVVELQAGLDSGHFTSVNLVEVRLFRWIQLPYLYLHFTQAYFARIEEVNLQGPQLRAVLELNPSALAQAAALDRERQTRGKRSALHGIPVLLKV